MAGERAEECNFNKKTNKLSTEIVLAMLMYLKTVLTDMQYVRVAYRIRYNESIPLMVNASVKERVRSCINECILSNQLLGKYLMLFACAMVVHGLDFTVFL